MKKYIVTRSEGIIEAGDMEAIKRDVKFTRKWTESSDWTDRYVCEESDEDGELTGRWNVCADDRGQNPIESKVLSVHATEAKADAESRRLNAKIDAALTAFALQDEIELPDEVTFVYLSGVLDGRYPQSRRATVSIRYQHSEFGPLEFEVGAYWSANTLCKRSMNTSAVVNALKISFQADLEKAIETARELEAE